MRFSRLGIFVLILGAVLLGTNCSYYNRIIARKNLVDGSQAYKDRQFETAETLFRKAIETDPQGETIEGRMAQLFLARTLHSEFIGNRQKREKAEEAIAEYKKALAVNKDDQSSYKAIASLYENLQMTDEWQAWVDARAADTAILPQHRAEALVSLAAKQNTCANDITDTEATKKTVTKDGKQAFQFVKPADPNEFAQLQQCVQKGTDLINQVTALEPPVANNLGSLDVKGMTDEQLRANRELLRVFESARSYRASLLIQAMRLAEMEGRTADQERLKTEAEQARAKFVELSEKVKEIQAEMDARAAAAQAAESANTAANAANQ